MHEAMLSPAMNFYLVYFTEKLPARRKLLLSGTYSNSLEKEKLVQGRTYLFEQDTVDTPISGTPRRPVCMVTVREKSLTGRRKPYKT